MRYSVIIDDYTHCPAGVADNCAMQHVVGGFGNAEGAYRDAFRVLQIFAKLLGGSTLIDPEKCRVFYGDGIRKNEVAFTAYVRDNQTQQIITFRDAK